MPRAAPTRRARAAVPVPALPLLLAALALAAAPRPARASSSAGTVQCASNMQNYECSCNNEVVNYITVCPDTKYNTYKEGPLAKYLGFFTAEDKLFKTGMEAAGSGTECFDCACYKADDWTAASNKFVGTCCAQECTVDANKKNEECMPHSSATQCTNAKCGTALETELKEHYAPPGADGTPTCSEASKEAIQNLIWNKCYFRYFYTKLTKPQQASFPMLRALAVPASPLHSEES